MRVAQIWRRDRSAFGASEMGSGAQRSDLEEPATFWYFVGSILEGYRGWYGVVVLLCTLMEKDRERRNGHRT